MSQTIGRNSPCPCGSGKKHKRCCLNINSAAGSAIDSSSLAGVKGASKEILMMMEGQNFTNLNETNAFIGHVSKARNERGIADFLGLSPTHIHRFIHYPFESSEYVVFPDVLDSEPDAPMMTLFTLMVAAIAETGLKATATGNLPRAFCREAFETFKATGFYDDKLMPRGINTELDFIELHEVRTIAELADLIVVEKNRFILTNKCVKLRSEQGDAAIYPCLLRTFGTQYNWGYMDGHPEASIIQSSFLFTLYMLKLQGEKEQAHVILAESFIKAFPVVVEEFETSTYLSSHDLAVSCYTQRALRGFCRLTGLATVRSVSGNIFDRTYTIQPLPLLNDAVRFQGKSA